MTHRAESILQAIETTLTGLSTTASRVERGRVWPVSSLPALTISKGTDSADESIEAGDEVFDSVPRALEVDIAIHAKPTGNPETILNAIAAEVYAALRVDRTLGLAYVYECEIAGDQAPELVDSQDTKLARMVSTWRIQYEHSLTSAEA